MELILIVLALVCFIGAAVNVQSSTINLVAAGLAFLTATLLL